MFVVRNNYTLRQFEEFINFACLKEKHNNNIGLTCLNDSHEIIKKMCVYNLKQKLFRPNRKQAWYLTDIISVIGVFF